MVKQNKATLVLLTLFASLVCNTALANEPAPTWTSSSDTSYAGKYVVDFEDDTNREEISSLMESLNISYHDAPLWEELKMEIVDVSGNSEALIKLRDQSDIEGVEPLIELHALGGYVGSLTPNDPLFKAQWHMPHIGVQTGWSYSIGRGVTVAVIDTGVACEDDNGFHKVSDLQQTTCVPGYNALSSQDGNAYDDHGHGTHVAGTIAQSTNNGIGGVGIAFGTRIMPVKVLSGTGSGSNASVAAGIHWAADNGADVINMSLGGSQRSDIIQRAVDHAREKGVVIVAAAGNSGGSVGFPAACDGVIAVSAIDQSDNIAKFSSRGPEVDIAAPGVAVTQNTICDHGKRGCEEFPAWNGTSMASPHVAGVAAQLVGLGVTDPDVIEDYLKRSAKDVGDNEHLYGAGRVQSDVAVQWVHWVQAGTRLAFLVVVSFLTFLFARRNDEETYSESTPEYWGPALLTGVGAFFVPLFLSRHHFLVDLLSRPLGDWSLFISAGGLHPYLPFANVFIPLGLAALCLKLHAGAAKWLAGVFVGTAAYLGSSVFLGHLDAPLGWTVMTTWFVGNALACMYVASLLLVKPKPQPA